MLKRPIWCGLILGCLVAALSPAPVQAQTCEPLNNGRLADVFHGGTALFFEPVVEFRTMTLTIGGPCEDIVKVFSPKEQIAFDLREIERLTDGQYTWELRREASVDPSVQNELQASRGTGEEEALWWSYFQKGAIPEGPYRDSGSFTVVRGEIIDPNSSGEEKSASLAGKGAGGGSSAAIQATLAGGLASGGSSGESGGNVLRPKDTVLTNANGVIRNSLCVGFDCLNSNGYSDTTILLTENNTRIKFDDTSTSSSFPRNDWEIEANSNLNGGANYLGFNDCGQSSGGGCASDLVFAVEAGVRQHALYVESDGDVGFGTNNPVVRLHMTDGDTPTMRLEQDGSSGFQPQTWDVAGNESNFFVRDATGGSTLPFRIFPGSPSNTLVIRDGNVGVGTSSPNARLHVRRTDGTASILVQEASGSSAQRTLLRLENNGAPAFTFQNTAATGSWSFFHANNDRFVISRDGSGTQEFAVAANGDILVGGSVVHTSSRDSKADFEQTDPEELLARLSAIPILEWRYKRDDEDVRHLGPMAEDFHAAFGLGTDDRTIALNDSIGVALGSIQALRHQAETKDLEIRSLRRENEELASRLETLESLVQSLVTDR